MSSVSMPANPDQPEVGLSVIALIFGFLSLFLGALIAVPGIIFGHIACARIKHNPYRFGGMRLAVAGLVLCYLMLLASLVVLVYLFTSPAHMHHLADYLGYSLVLAEG
ncbi:DUF4190 domain-containing protein [Leucothrix pacifica]|uniref:DUF4190 domain-containing protein n=1 Tax=Leucothrix pacifica TaxID=1247513 RepID=A0A317CNN7_9GAMM|nr:DUF4190 domain-containing protein [Leucothrix pacifica]PWQ99093.1 hypothetical protein DKW60_06550 [Leucothrix pacifica]